MALHRVTQKRGDADLAHDELVLEWRRRLKREAGGKSADKRNLVCGPVQICWDKFARYFDVGRRQLPLLSVLPLAICQRRKPTWRTA